MCRSDLAAKEAAIARFLQEYPHAVDAGHGHPALRGCEDVRWSEYPECPAAIPVLLRSLLDPEAAPDAERTLANSVLNSVSEMNAAMPAVLPFMLRLASYPQLPERSRLLDRLASVAARSLPVDADNEAMVQWFGSDSDHPEREQCRAVFKEHAGVVAVLAEQLSSPDGRAKVRQAAGLV